MNLFEVLIKGGWVMIPIALSSILVIAIGVTRFLNLRKERNILSIFISRWKKSSGASDIKKFQSSCELGPEFCVQAVSIFKNNTGAASDLSDSLETVGSQELYRLESGLATIATLAAVTPLLGFLGTVTGMIKAFMHIQSLGGNVNANVLAGGIWEALVTTAAGLAVGILALLVYNYLTSVVKSCARMMEDCGEIMQRAYRGN